MARNTHVPAEQLEADIRAGTIDTVIVAFSDHQGRLIGKRTDGEFYLDVVVEEGTENCDYLIACDLDDVPIPGFTWASYEQGYGDMRGVVDPTTIRYLPWLESTALVLVDLVDVDDGRAGRGVAAAHPAAAGRGGGRARLHVDDRQRGRVLRLPGALRRRQRATATAHLTPNSPWLEDYNILQTTKEEDLIGRIRRGLRGAGLPVEFSKGEAGRGQHELNLTFQPALEMADTNMVFKNAVKEIAAQVGRSVTFMAKPHFDDGGNSCHIHSSLWADDGTRSVMAGDGEHHMSDEFRWYLGGLMATAREFSLLFAPNVNSYKRFQPGSWAPTGVGWDTDNRTLGFRVVGHGQGMRVESRIPGADANAYHAFAATIAGGLHGISERIEPPEPYHGNGYTADDLPRIPSTYVEAIELWRGSDLARHVLRRRRPPPRAQPRRVRVACLQRHRHRLGTSPVLRADLTWPPTARSCDPSRPATRSSRRSSGWRRRSASVSSRPANASRRARARRTSSASAGSPCARRSRRCSRPGTSRRSAAARAGPSSCTTRPAPEGRCSPHRPAARHRRGARRPRLPLGGRARCRRAGRDRGGWATSDADRLRAALAAATDCDPAMRRVCDSRFHVLIGELSGSASLAAAVADVQGRLDGLLAAIPVFAKNIAHSDAQHARITRAVLRGRANVARTVMAEHVEATAALLRGLLT